MFVVISYLTKLEFNTLNIFGENYLSWILNAKIHLNVMGLSDTIKNNNDSSFQDRAKAMIYLRHHLHQALKIEYLTIKKPYVLWSNLYERYGHLRSVIFQMLIVNEMLSGYKILSQYMNIILHYTELPHN